MYVLNVSDEPTGPPDTAHAAANSHAVVLSCQTTERTAAATMTLQAIRYQNGTLEVLDQLLLPKESKYIPILGVEDGWKVINKMQVRGAPAIAIVGCLSLAVEISKEEFEKKKALRREVEGKLNYLISARPTAVNMKQAADHLISYINSLDNDESVSAQEMQARFVAAIEAMLEKDISDNRSIGEYGAKAILNSITDGEQVRILTHCNTGSLATAYFGTALGVVRCLHSTSRLEKCYFTETRPYNQGARLTAYELVHDKIPSTLVCDSTVAYLMKTAQISAVVVGADRVAANGDTANKIGTYQIAVVAKHHDVPFYVAAPLTSIDFNVNTGDNIIIEERPQVEMTHINNIRIASPGVTCWNPAFDVTPARLITGIITEKGVFQPSELSTLQSLIQDHKNSLPQL